jgi:hypothetical protein
VKQLHNYVLEHHISTEHQSGFQPKYSTVSQLVYIYNTIISNLDIGKDIRFILCDISKAFDRVWHTGLLYELREIGIDGNLLSWVTDYLDDRKQKVVLDGFSSGWERIDAGVSQGSNITKYKPYVFINIKVTDNSVVNIYKLIYCRIFWLTS